MREFKIYHEGPVSLGADILLDGQKVDNVVATHIDFDARKPVSVDIEGASMCLFSNIQFENIKSVELIIKFED